MLESSTLRPGFLVSLKTSVKGNVSYFKTTIEDDHLVESGAKVAVWETKRNVEDPAEHEKAKQVRNKAGAIIRAVCSATAFGLLCPEDRADALEKAIKEARVMADAFNREATITQIGIYVITGRVAQNDVEAVRAINSEIRELMEDMEEGLKNLNVVQVRNAANKAKGIGQMLSADASQRVQNAIDVARKSARAIVAAGEGVAVEIDLQAIKQIEQQRTAFLELDDTAAVAAVVETGRAVELDHDPIEDGLTDEERAQGFKPAYPNDVVPDIEL